jgi:hypothetical protein
LRARDDYYTKKKIKSALTTKASMESTKPVEGGPETLYIHTRSNWGPARSAGADDVAGPISSAESVALSRDLRRLSKIISKAKEANTPANENGPSTRVSSSVDKRPPTYIENPFNTPRSAAAQPMAQIRPNPAAADRHAPMTTIRRASSSVAVSDVRPLRRHVSWAEGTNPHGAHPQTEQAPSSNKPFVEDLHDQLVEAVGPFVHAYLSLPPGVNPLLPHVSGGPARPPPPPPPHPPAPPPPDREEDGALGVHLAPRFLVYGEDLRNWAAARVSAPEPLPAGETIVL